MASKKRATKSTAKTETKKIEKTLEHLAAEKKEDSTQIRLVRREGDDAPPILFYESDKGVKLELRFAEGEPWFTYGQMASMFGVAENTAIEHVQKFLED